MPAEPPYVIESDADIAPDTLFHDNRDQVVVAVRITPVFGQLDLTIVARLVDQANEHGFNLVREQTFRDEWLLCVFEAAYDGDE